MDDGVARGQRGGRHTVAHDRRAHPRARHAHPYPGRPPGALRRRARLPVLFGRGAHTSALGVPGHGGRGPLPRGKEDLLTSFGALAPWVADALVILGIAVMTLGVYGIIWMPDVYNKLHAASKVVFLGVISLLVATT